MTGPTIAVAPGDPRPVNLEKHGIKPKAKAKPKKKTKRKKKK